MKALFLFAVAIALAAVGECASFKFATKGASPCILLNVDGNFTFTATTNATVTKTLTTDTGNVTDGTCATEGATLTIGLTGDNKAQWKLIFSVQNDVVQLNQLVTFEPQALFGASIPDTVMQMFDDPGMTSLSSKTGSYVCDKMVNAKFNNITSSEIKYTVEVTLAKLHVQAFSVSNGTFSNETGRCSDDLPTAATTSATTEPPKNTTVTTEPPKNTTITTEPPKNTTVTTEPPKNTTVTTEPPKNTTHTTGPTTTATPATTTPGAPHKNNYTVTGDNNTVCIYLEGGISLAIKYIKKDNSSATKEINVPADAKGDGSCGKDMQTLVLSFFEDWGLAFVFERVSKLTAAAGASDNADYSVTSITFNYTRDAMHFPDARDTGSGSVVFNATSKFMKASAKGYYRCDSDISTNLNDDIEMTTDHLKYKAFNTNNKTEFSGDVSECSADDDSSSVVPIAVGAALAGLVVFVLIAYLIGRRRSRKAGYESV